MMREDFFLNLESNFCGFILKYGKLQGIKRLGCWGFNHNLSKIGKMNNFEYFLRTTQIFELLFELINLLPSFPL